MNFLHNGYVIISRLTYCLVYLRTFLSSSIEEEAFLDQERGYMELERSPRPTAPPTTPTGSFICIPSLLNACILMTHVRIPCPSAARTLHPHAHLNCICIYLIVSISVCPATGAFLQPISVLDVTVPRTNRGTMLASPQPPMATSFEYLCKG